MVGLQDKFNNKVLIATKWSFITEILAKLVTPITNMVLARILVPEAFGMVATVTMVISFMDLFTDSGFQKFLIQHEFKDSKEQYQYATVAFWTNLLISCLFFGVVAIFSEQIGTLVGSAGLGNAIIVASIQLPLTSFSSIQTAIFRRELDFHTLFVARIFIICVPFCITIPLAYSGFGYWSLIIGTLIGQLINTIVLTLKSKWSPSFYYSFLFLKRMISFSFWTLLESLSIWLTSWIDIFIIGSLLDSYSLGLYRTSLNTVNLIFSVVLSAIIPVIFSTLCRVQDNDKEFKSIFYKNQYLLSLIILPMGVGIFLYSDVITIILLGKEWISASYIIGIWGLTTAFKIILSDLNSECYRAKGKPKLSLLLQVSQLIFLVPACLISLNYGFKTLVYTRALIRIQLIITSLLILNLTFSISIKKILKQIQNISIACVGMIIISIILKGINDSFYFQLISIFICASIYLLILFIISKESVLQVWSQLKTVTEIK